MAHQFYQWLEAYWRGLFYRKQYLQYLSQRYQFFDVTELVTQGEFALDSEHVFVQPYLEPQPPHKIRSAIVRDEVTQAIHEFHKGSHYIWDYLHAETLTNQHFVILAGPGYGKTTLLKHLVLSLAANNRKLKQHKSSYKLPILLFLRDYATSIRANIDLPKRLSESISPVLYSQLRDTLLNCGTFTTDQELRSLFVDSRIRPWRDLIPSAPSPASRVEAIVDLLHNKYRNTQENALVLFLHVLLDRNDSNTSCHQNLAKIANELTVELVYTQQAIYSPRQLSAVFNREYTLSQAIHESVTKYGGPKAPSEWFERRLKQGNCLVMLDGLDEVVDPMIRKQVVAWVEHQIVVYPKNRFILTSRPHGYLENPLNRATVLEVMNFGGDQIQKFVQNWYAANETPHSQIKSAEVPAKAKENANDLLHRIWETPALYKLATNPLLLTMMVYVHRYRALLPKRRIDLYAEAHQVLLSKRPEPPNMIPADKQRALQPLAYAMMNNRQHEIPTEEASHIIAEKLNYLAPGISGTKFLKTVENVSGLLWEREDNIYSFSHLTFQEYLASLYIYEAHQHTELLNRVEDSWWHETIRLYCAQGDATAIVQACLADERLADSTFRLAMECLDEAQKVGPDIQIQLENVLYKCLADTKLKQIVSNALRDIRNNRLIRIAENKYVDTGLITHAEYQVFLHDVEGQGKKHQPDHWLQRHFPKKQSRMPVVGLQPSDSLAFCEWLTQNEGGGIWFYRLPTTDELKGMGGIGFNPNIGYWATAQQGYQYQGSEGISISENKLQQKMMEDTVWHPVYNPSTFLFLHPKLLPVGELWKLLHHFDFPRVRSRVLLNTIHRVITWALPQSEIISKSLKPLVPVFKNGIREYNERCYEINRQIGITQEKINGLQQERSRLEANEQSQFNEVANQANQEIAKVQEGIKKLEGASVELKNREQVNLDDISRQADQIISDYKTEIAKIETENTTKKGEIQAVYSEQYAQIDHLITHYRAEIIKFEGLRSTHHVDEAIAGCQSEISRLEQFRHQYKQEEQKAYADLANVVRNNLAQYQAAIADIEKQRQKHQNEIRSNHENHYQQIREGITNSQSAITNLEQQRKSIQMEVHSKYKDAYSQIAQYQDQHQSGIALLVRQRSEYEAEIEKIYRKAAIFEGYLDGLPNSVKAAFELLPEVAEFTEDYFSQSRKRVFDLQKFLKHSSDVSQQLIVFIGENFSGISDDFTHDLNQFANRLKETLGEAQTLKDIIDLSLKLESELVSASHQIHTLRFDDLVGMGIARKANRELAVSLESAYYFICSRGRELNIVSSWEEVRNRLHYVRLCALAVAGEFIEHPSQNNDHAHLMKQFIQLYVKLCMLEVRMQGGLSACEGIRIIKERVKV